MPASALVQPAAACDEATLAGLMQGRIPQPVADGFWDTALTAARAHGVTALLHRGLRAACWDQVPATVRTQLRMLSARAAAAAVLNDRDLTHTLDLLAAAGVYPLLVKGAGISHTHYPDPVLRPRADSDLWISDAERAPLDRALDAAGYTLPVAIDGDLLSHQRSYIRTSTAGLRHCYDVHWRISNHPLVAHGNMFDHRACTARAVAVPQLGPNARALGPADALLLACVHRLAHHADEERLIWLYDVHLLVDAMDARQTELFFDLSGQARLDAVCRDAIEAAAGYFGCRNVLMHNWLRATPVEDGPALGLLKRPRRLDRFASHMRSLPGWGLRLRFLWQNTFPSPAYMARRYQVDRRWKLPLHYGLRLFHALRKLLR